MKEKKLISSHDEQGREVPDSTPMQLPVGFERPQTIQELVRSLIKYEVSRIAGEEGEESFEEADDFEVGDEPELLSPYELDDEMERASMTEFIEEQPAVKPGAGKRQQASGSQDGGEDESEPAPAKIAPAKGKKRKQKPVQEAPEEEDEPGE